MKPIESISEKEIEEAEDFQMPFGAYKGQRLKAIPNSYLYWVAENIKNDKIASKADLICRYRERFNIEIE